MAEMSKVGGDLVEAVAEMAAHLRGEIEVFSYEAPEGLLTPEKIKTIRRKQDHPAESGAEHESF